MGFFGWLKKAGKKVGSVISGGAKKVGQVIKDPSKIGDVAKKVVDVVKKVAPFVEKVPYLGAVVKAVVKGDKILDLGKKILKGDIKGAIKSGVDIGTDLVPGVKEAKKLGSMAKITKSGFN